MSDSSLLPNSLPDKEFEALARAEAVRQAKVFDCSDRIQQFVEGAFHGRRIERKYQNGTLCPEHGAACDHIKPTGQPMCAPCSEADNGPDYRAGLVVCPCSCHPTEQPLCCRKDCDERPVMCATHFEEAMRPNDAEQSLCAEPLLAELESIAKANNMIIEHGVRIMQICEALREKAPEQALRVPTESQLRAALEAYSDHSAYVSTVALFAAVEAAFRAE